MSARTLGIELAGCACGRAAKRCSESAAGTMLYWIACPNCGAKTAKSDSQADAESAWNEGDVSQSWNLPVAFAGISHPATTPAPADSLREVPPAPQGGRKTQ